MRTRTRLTVTLLASAALLAGLAAPASALSPTEQVADINAGAADSFPYDFIVVGDLLYFTADDGTGTELFYTDGSIGSATKIDINPAGASNPADFTLIGSDLYFSADTGLAYGRELLVVSGGGFVGVVADINPGIADSTRPISQSSMATCTSRRPLPLRARSSASTTVQSRPTRQRP